MFYDNELLFLQKMLKKSHVHCAVIQPNKPLAQQTETGLHYFFPFKDPKRTFYDLVPGFRTATVYRISDVLRCRYIFLDLPYGDTPLVLFVGPYLNAPLEHQQVLELAESHAVPPRLERELELYYSAIPVVREEHHLFAMVNTFAEYLWNGEENYDSVDLLFELPGNAAEHLSVRVATETEGLDMQVMENRYQFENELMEAVSQGNSHKAEAMMAGFSNFSYQERAGNQLRNMQNYCIIMNTLMRKAAEKGRVHPVHLDRVSSNFAFRIEALRSLNEVGAFMTEIMHTYCRLVKRHSMRNYSPLVQKVLFHIENDLTGDLTLRTVAQHHNVSAGYLSGLFKKETGQTFTGFVNGRRVAHAKRLLKTTGLQIQTIAQHCGILDFHYFCRLFKTVTGMTPTEYRNDYVID